MKKKIICCFIIVCAVLALQTEKMISQPELSSLSLSNIEALAGDDDVDDILGYPMKGYYFCGVGNPTVDMILGEYSNYCGYCELSVFVRTGSGYCR